VSRAGAARLGCVASAVLGLTIPPGAAWADPSWPEQSQQDNLGLRVTLGRAWITGIDSAFYERIELDAFTQLEDDDGLVYGPLIGMFGGIDLWGGGDGSFGFGLPLGLNLGVRHTLVSGELPVQAFVVAGLGADVLLWDFAQSQTGFGVLGPLSNLVAGFDLAVLRVAFDAEAQYRWPWGAPDRFLFGLGGSLGVHAPL
jgi:hypothetical protein